MSVSDCSLLLQIPRVLDYLQDCCLDNHGATLVIVLYIDVILVGGVLSMQF